MEATLIDGSKLTGTLMHKDESFVMLKIREQVVRILHWETICDIFRVEKRGLVKVNLAIFKKSRE